MDGDKDIVDLLCEYDLYYEAFKDDPNDPFCRPSPQVPEDSHDSSSQFGPIIYYLVIAAIVFLAIVMLID